MLKQHFDAKILLITQYYHFFAYYNYKLSQENLKLVNLVSCLNLFNHPYIVLFY